LIITKTVEMLFQSQTARMCKLRHALPRQVMKLTVSSAWGTLHCLWCAGLLCGKFKCFVLLLVKCFVWKKWIYFIFMTPKKCVNQA